MSKKRILKVCKIDSISFASFAIKQGVDFLGVHILDESSIGRFRKLIAYIKSNDGKAIIVTKIQTEAALEKLIETYAPNGIQFHFEIEQQLILNLRKKFPGLLLFGVFTNQSNFTNLDVINNLFDFLIYDTSYRGGTNQNRSYDFFERFPQSLKAKTLLAGGINSKRIEELNEIGAYGYDIQSHFRAESGLSYRNLEKVCDSLKFPRCNMMSVSLTDLSLSEIQKASSYHLNKNLEYHLDFSPGLLYPSFNTIDNSIEEKQQHLGQLPYSMHLFIDNENDIRKKIAELDKKYPLSLTRIIVQYFYGLNTHIYTEQIADVKIVPSIFYKDLDNYISQSIKLDVLSIIVPKPQNVKDIKTFISTMIAYKKFFTDKEVWLERNLSLGYIRSLKQQIGDDFNFIIGKEVINDWSKINSIYEYLHE